MAWIHYPYSCLFHQGHHGCAIDSHNDQLCSFAIFFFVSLNVSYQNQSNDRWKETNQHSCYVTIMSFLCKYTYICKCISPCLIGLLYRVYPIKYTHGRVVFVFCFGIINSMWTKCFIWTLRPREIGLHFADNIFKCIFVTENVWIPIEISLKFVPKGAINNNPALVQIMAWRRPGDKPLSEAMMVSFPTH